MKNFICSLLSAERGSLSSKRLCGAIGWLSCSANQSINQTTTNNKTSNK